MKTYYLKRACFTFILVCSWTGILRADIGKKDLLFQEFSVNNGLSQYDVTSILQDSIGYIWIGTYDGLNRYNGFENQVYRHSDNAANSLPGNRVLCLAEGPGGNVWIGTEDGGLGVFNIFKERFTPVIPKNRVMPNSISALFFDDDHLIAGTTYGSIYVSPFESKGDTVVLAFEEIQTGKENYTSTNLYVSSINTISNTLLIGFLDGDLIQFRKAEDGYAYQQSLSNPGVTDIFIDHQDRVWVGTFNGLSCYNYLEGYETFIDVSPDILKQSSDNRITSISEDINRNIWYTTYLNGLFQLTRGEDYGEVLMKFSTQNSEIGVDNLSTTYIDRSNSLWLGSHTDGVRITDLSQKEFYKVSFYKDVLAASGPIDHNLLMSSCFVDHAGNLWAGIQERGLFMHTRNGETYHFSAKDDGSGLHTNTVTRIIEDRNRNLWLASWQGLYKLSALNSRTRNFSFGQIDPGVEFAGMINSESHFSICEDLDGNLWLGGYGGLYKLILSGSGECLKSIDYSSVISDNEISYWTMSLASNDQQRIIMAGTKGGGLVQIRYSDNTEEINVQHFSPNKEGRNYISNNNIWTIRLTRKEAWIGTDNGVNILALDETGYGYSGNLTTDHGLLSNKIVSIEIDMNGNMWLGTGLGLSKCNPHTYDIWNYDYHDGLQSNSFNETSATDDDGRLFFGGINGLSYFHPDQITENYAMPEMNFTSFYIRNQKIEPGTSINGKVITSRSIPFVEGIQLDYFSNDFSIDFQSFNYSTAINNIYEYKLEGYDEDWLYAKGNNRTASYSNLRYGNYIFRARMANTEEHKSYTTKSLSILISRPPWLSWWAFILYILSGSGFIYFIIRYFAERSKHRHEILIEKHKAEQIQELNDLKIRFFMNISHELRTPLTLILEPLQLLRDQAKKTSGIRRYAELAFSNAQKLHYLISQLLEFRQTETGNKGFKPVKEDLVAFVEGIFESFTILTDKKSIHFLFKTEPDALQVYFDKDIIEKILSNLISNAIKFTGTNGSISLEIILSGDLESRSISISVTDNGVGIPPEQQQKIFERFYQGKGNSGFGIGLAFSSNLAKIHRGELTVESEPGKGSSFCLSIPLVESMEDESEENIADGEQEHDRSWLSVDVPENRIDTTEKAGILEERVILLVEDNHDLREFVSSYLAEHYTVFTAENGQEASEIALKELPDIIITDIMMPVLDGIGLAKKLSADIHTNHIPLIFLTAKDKPADLLSGFETGAVDYIVKPFNVVYLQKKVENLLNNLKLQQEKARIGYLQVSGKDTKGNAGDDFLIKAIEIVESNLSNSDFDVTQFCTELGVSRMQLHRKFKGIVGQSTTEFIKSVRIKHAAELLSRGQYNVSEAMYEVGFDNPSYFTKSFKKIYGVNPSEFKN